MVKRGTKEPKVLRSGPIESIPAGTRCFGLRSSDATIDMASNCACERGDVESVVCVENHHGGVLPVEGDVAERRGKDGVSCDQVEEGGLPIGRIVGRELCVEAG